MSSCWAVILYHILFRFNGILNQVKVKSVIHLATILKLFVFIMAEGGRKKKEVDMAGTSDVRPFLLLHV